ncbi:MAG: alpha/beta hydrolase [Myxococcota bacterium]
MDEERFVEVHRPPNTHRVYVRSAGEEGPTFVLIHGLACNLTFFEDQVTPLGELGRVVRIDLPGHGRSDVPEVSYTLDFMVEAVRTVLSELGIQQAIFIGHSMGELVVRRLYARVPERFLAYIALDGLVYYEPFGCVYGGVGMLMRTPLYRSIWGSFVGQMMSKHTPDDLKTKISTTMLAAPPFVVKDLTNAILTIEDTDQAPIEVPVLALNAGEFNYAAPELTDKIRSIAPTSERVVLAGVGHFLHAEASDQVNRLIVSFVRRFVTATP